MNKIFKKYAWIGLLTFIPIIISGYYILDIFGTYLDALMRRNYSNEFNISNSQDRGILIGGISFVLIFFTYCTAISSSFLYILSHFKQREKWLLLGHKFRIITWIPVILGGLILLGIFSMIAIREL